MAQIRIQPKSVPPTPKMALRATWPIALVLGAGLATTLLLENGRQAPNEAVTAVAPAATGVWEWMSRTWLGAKPLEAGGRAWVIADHPPVGWFEAREMVVVGEASGWPLYANRERGLPGLSAQAGPYDRLYVRTAPDTYAPLRWRDVQAP